MTVYYISRIFSQSCCFIRSFHVISSLKQNKKDEKKKILHYFPVVSTLLIFYREREDARMTRGTQQCF